MLRRLSTVALVVVVATSSLAIPGCGNQAAPPKQDATTNDTGTGGKAQSLPQDVTVDLAKGVKLEMLLIPAGEFLMGSLHPTNDAPGTDLPQHRVRITKPFYLGKYPVTQQQWQAVMGENPSLSIAGADGPEIPVIWVDRDDCERFPKKLNASFKRPEGDFALPTEAQWEYACRAGSTTRFYFGDDQSKLGDYAWYNGNSDMKLHPVGQKKPNAWGLYDMSGNVTEWCADALVSYKELPVDDPIAPYNGPYGVCRGGGCFGSATGCRSSCRAPGPTNRSAGVGLRVALVPASK